MCSRNRAAWVDLAEVLRQAVLSRTVPARECRCVRWGVHREPLGRWPAIRVSKISQKWPLLGCAQGWAQDTLEVVRMYREPLEDLEALMSPSLRGGDIGGSGRGLPDRRAPLGAR
ncbi:hypothetical protein GCM10011591_39780 [Nocardia camponoti]|uniref:Uncharacterized protein n=1 Tax=Nocardia camponoti TaxID=1616106 RepID=A0A917QQQ7_9NOCA|nr:hypothetical protein GCM10011591_39780 [Nocardia camponoti]